MSVKAMVSVTPKLIPCIVKVEDVETAVDVDEVFEFTLETHRRDVDFKLKPNDPSGAVKADVSITAVDNDFEIEYPKRVWNPLFAGNTLSFHAYDTEGRIGIKLREL